VNDKAELSSIVLRSHPRSRPEVGTAEIFDCLIPVGEVTLISVKYPSMTSIPAKAGRAA